MVLHMFLFSIRLTLLVVPGRTTAIKPMNQTLPTGSDYPISALSPGTVASPISLAAVTPSGAIAYRRHLQATPC